MTGDPIRDRTRYIDNLPSAKNQGKLPRDVSVADLRALGHPVSPVDAIRAYCIGCGGGALGEVRKCPAIGCPLWAFRMGINPFHGRPED